MDHSEHQALTIQETFAEKHFGYTTGSLSPQLWSLLARQSALFTMGEHSSIPVETAGELLQSILYCLELAPDSGERDLALRLELGQQAVKRQMQVGKGLLEQVQATALPLDNLSYQDTLSALPHFFRQYDLRFFAHQTPVDIDYQLACPVPEGLTGILYLNQYLRRLLVENRFCACFPTQTASALLRAYCPQPREQLINLLLPLLTNALGRACLGQEPLGLHLSEQDRRELYFLLSKAPSLWELLAQTTEHVVEQLSLTGKDTAAYLQEAAQTLVPGIQAALRQGELSGIFLSLSQAPEENLPLYQDGPSLPDEQLRSLLEELQECRFASLKLAIIREQIHSLEDLRELLHVGVCHDILEGLLSLLGDQELGVLLCRIGRETDNLPNWGQELHRYISRLSPSRRREVQRFLEAES